MLGTTCFARMAKGRGKLRAGKRRTGIEVVLLLALLFFFSAGCGSFWASVRDGERSRSEKKANTYFKDGRCQRALKQLDRAEAEKELGSYGAQGTYQRAVCLDNLGHEESARANYLMVVDFYPKSRMKELALQKLGGAEEIQTLSQIRDEASSLAVLRQIQIPSPRYSEAAERSGVVGDVIVMFTMNADQEVSDIRVVHMDHPLLASWSIEAVSNATLHEGATLPNPPARTLSRLVFTSFWHGDGEAETEKAK